MFDIRVLRLVFGPDRKKEKPNGRKLRKVDLTFLNSSQMKFSDQNKNEGMITACGRQGEKR